MPKVPPNGDEKPLRAKGSSESSRPGARAEYTKDAANSLQNLEDRIDRKMMAGAATTSNTVSTGSSEGGMETRTKLEDSLESSRPGVRAEYTKDAANSLQNLEDRINRKMMVGAATTSNTVSTGSSENGMETLARLEAETQEKLSSSSLYDLERSVFPHNANSKTMVPSSNLNSSNWLKNGVGETNRSSAGGTKHEEEKYSESPEAPRMEASYEDINTNLAVAMPVDEEENAFAPTAVEYDPSAKPAVISSNGFRMKICKVAAFVVVAIVAVVVGITQTRKTSVPYRETLGIRESVIELVGPENLGKAPYLQALEWITHNDTMELVPEDGVQFEQRYILAYTYFALTRDHDWDDCNRFEEGATSNLCTCVGCVPRRGGTKWLGTDSECNWSGNFCNENGVLEKIQLNMVNATGSFPEGVFHLSSLISLNIDMNQLDGRLPSDLSALPDLEELILSGNAFTGPIPDKWFGMNKLTTLKLEKNSITGTLSTRIGELTSLENLILTSNQIASTIPTEIALPPLVFVELEQNFFNGTIPTEVGNMEKMRELLLDINNLVGEIPTELGSCSNLAFFTASENALTGGLPDELFDLKKLQWIKLELNSLNGTISTSFGTLTEMTELYLNDNDFTGTVPTELGELTKMEEFRLSGTMLNGAVPQEVCDLHDSVIGLLVSADCDSDKIDCDCCTSCCDAEGENCRNVEP